MYYRLKTYFKNSIKNKKKIKRLLLSTSKYVYAEIHYFEF